MLSHIVIVVALVTALVTGAGPTVTSGVVPKPAVPAPAAPSEPAEVTEPSLPAEATESVQPAEPAEGTQEDAARLGTPEAPEADVQEPGAELGTEQAERTDDGVTVRELPVSVPVAPYMTTFRHGDAQADEDAVVADDRAGDRVLTDVVQTEDVQTVGVTWPVQDDAPDPDVLVRTLQDDSWSPWTELPVSDGAPDAGTPDAENAATRDGTDPVWIGDADAVQLSFASDAATPDDMTLTMIGSPEEGSAATTVASAAGADVATAFHVGGAAVTPAAAQPAGIIRRSQWGAPAQVCTPSTASTLTHVVLHHTAGSNSYSTVAQAMQQMRNDANYHIRGRGWCDLGYNFVIDKWGNIYEGRGGSMDRPTVGVHAGGFNTNSLGISMLGTYTTSTPSAAVQEAVARITAWKLAPYYRDPAGSVTITTGGGENSKYGAGSTVTLPVVFGHRDVAFTTCPGNGGQSTLPWIRSRARALVGPTLVNPSATARTISQGGTVQVRAATISDLDWRLEVRDTRTNVRVRVDIGRAAERLGGVVATWRGVNSWGEAVGPGRYRLHLTATDVPSGRAVRSWETFVEVTGSQSPPTVAPAPFTGDLTFVPITPARVLDTRTRGLSLGPRSRRDITVAGVSGVPADARAVALNVTAVGVSDVTHIRAWPAGAPLPDTSVLNADPNRDAAAAAVTIGVGGERKVSLYNNAGSAHLVVDVTGYYTTDRTADGFAPLDTAFRALDTRDGGGRFSSQERRTVSVAGRGGVPSNARAVVVNVTSVNPDDQGYVNVVPAGAANTTSTVNHLPRHDSANRATVALSRGSLDVVLVGGRADVVVDVVGWYGPGATARFTPVQPVRAADTRTSGGPLKDGESRTLAVGSAARLPSDAVAAVMTLTTFRQTARATHLIAWPAGSPRPRTSDLNTGSGRDQSGMAVVRLGRDRAITVYNDTGSTGLAIDVTGYFR